MRDNFQARYEKERNAKANRVLWLCGLGVAVLFACGIIDKHNREKAEKAEKERIEARTNAFAHYIIDDAYAVAADDVRTNKFARARNVARIYSQYDSDGLKEYIRSLQADSATYADAIVRDAPIIHEIDGRAEKEVDFSEAWNIVRDMPKDSYRPKYEREYIEQSDGDVVCTGLRPIDGTKVYQGASTAGIMTINHRELNKVCKDLILYRQALAKKTR